MQGAIKDLQASLASKKATATIFTLGFGRDHDAQFLGALTRAGTTEGTFHYIESSAAIISTMDTIKDLMLATSFAPCMQLETMDGQLITAIPLALQHTAAASSGGEAKLQTLMGIAHVASVPSAGDATAGASVKAKVSPGLRDIGSSLVPACLISASWHASAQLPIMTVTHMKHWMLSCTGATVTAQDQVSL